MMWDTLETVLKSALAVLAFVFIFCYAFVKLSTSLSVANLLKKISYKDIAKHDDTLIVEHWMKLEWALNDGMFGPDNLFGPYHLGNGDLDYPMSHTFRLVLFFRNASRGTVRILSIKGLEPQNLCFVAYRTKNVEFIISATLNEFDINVALAPEGISESEIIDIGMRIKKQTYKQDAMAVFPKTMDMKEIYNKGIKYQIEYLDSKNGYNLRTLILNVRPTWGQTLDSRQTT